MTDLPRKPAPPVTMMRLPARGEEVGSVVMGESFAWKAREMEQRGVNRFEEVIVTHGDGVGV
jgi:hypothetical protein